MIRLIGMMFLKKIFGKGNSALIVNA